MTERVEFSMVDALSERPRHFLFLQGLPGPFFRILGRDLARHGALVSRVNFNGGDVFDWPFGRTFWFRKKAESWPAWLSEFIKLQKVTDIILFGDCRPLHLSARQISERLGLSVHVFEEGYLRPNHVTLELSGVNGNSTLPVALEDYRALAPFLGAPGPELPIRSSFGRRAREALAYNFAWILLRPLFWHFCSHRPNSISQEALGWIKRWLRRLAENKASAGAMMAIANRPFFLVPLQLEGDAQISHHSDFSSMKSALFAIMESFAKNAADGTVLLIKRHPFDPDIENWRQIIEAETKRLGITGRAYFVERAELDPLLNSAVAVVTINSTVGPLALARAVPVIALGEAIYRVEGLTSGLSLDEFWTNPGNVNQADFDLFCRVLKTSSLLNGGFHDREAVRLLVIKSRDRLLAPGKSRAEFAIH